MTRSGFFLESDPFAPGDTGPCFFSTAELRHRLDRILRSARQGARHICIVAPRGSGKTTLLQQVLKDLRPRWQVASVSGAPELDRAALLAGIGRAFGLVPGEAGPAEEILGSLDTHFAALPRSGENALVAVDDVDALSAQTRACCDALAARWRPSRVRFITAREPAPEDPAGGSDPETDAGAPALLIDIPPLTRAQSDDYVHTRLCAAGLRGDSPFTDEMLRSVCNASGGRPGRIHHVAGRMLANQQPGRTRNKGTDTRLRRRPWSRLAAGLRLPGRRGV